MWDLLSGAHKTPVRQPMPCTIGLAAIETSNEKFVSFGLAENIPPAIFVQSRNVQDWKCHLLLLGKRW